MFVARADFLKGGFFDSGICTGQRESFDDLGFRASTKANIDVTRMSAAKLCRIHRPATQQILFTLHSRHGLSDVLKLFEHVLLPRDLFLLDLCDRELAKMFRKVVYDESDDAF
jgi:hypothetical protein